MIAVGPLRGGDKAAWCRLHSGYVADMPGPRGASHAEAVWDSIAPDGVGKLGAWLDGQLAGFAIYFVLPEIISGGYAGPLEDLYVAPDRRSRGIGRRLIEEIAREGRRAGWVHLRWIAPLTQSHARKLYDQIAREMPWVSYAIDLRVEGGTSPS